MAAAPYGWSYIDLNPWQLEPMEAISQYLGFFLQNKFNKIFFLEKVMIDILRDYVIIYILTLVQISHCQLSIFWKQLSL